MCSEWEAQNALEIKEKESYLNESVCLWLCIRKDIWVETSKENLG